MTCTAKVPLWNHDLEIAFYDGEQPHRVVAELPEDEKIELGAAESTERSNGLEVPDMKRPWVVKARLAFGYPGSLDIENMEASMAAHKKDTRDNPRNFKIELSEAYD